jgi:hypothetical protein
MRWVFGLGGLLITLGVIVFIMASPNGPLAYTQAVLKKGQEARVDAGQIAGIDEATGMRTGESIVMDPVTSPGGSRVIGLGVTSIVVGGPMEKYFGLKANDNILEVGPQRIRDINDDELAKAQVLEAYQRKQELVIERAGVRYRMPGLIPVDAVPGAPTPVPTVATPTAAPTAAATPAPADQGTTPAPAPHKRSSIYDQVNQIPGVQTEH